MASKKAAKKSASQSALAKRLRANLGGAEKLVRKAYKKSELASEQAISARELIMFAEDELAELRQDIEARASWLEEMAGEAERRVRDLDADQQTLVAREDDLRKREAALKAAEASLMERVIGKVANNE